MPEEYQNKDFTDYYLLFYNSGKVKEFKFYDIVILAGRRFFYYNLVYF